MKTSLETTSSMCGGSSKEDSHCNLGTHHPGTTATIRGHEGDTQPMPQPRTLLQNGRHGRNIRPWRHYIIAAEAVIDRAVVEDRVQDTVWNTRPGFPGLTLKNVAFESPQPSHPGHWGSAHHRISTKTLRNRGKRFLNSIGNARFCTSEANSI